MSRTVALCALLKPKRFSGGILELDSFQLRAAAFSARVTLKLQRFIRDNKGVRRYSLEAQRDQGYDRASIKRLKLKVGRLIKLLEREMKRAARRSAAAGAGNAFEVLSEEWRAHLRWMQVHLAYFTPYRPGSGIGRLQRKRIDRLVAMVNAIAIAGSVAPNEKLLRKTIRGFVHECHLGRVGYHDFLYMLRNELSPTIQAELFEYVASKMQLEDEEMRKNQGKATSIAHRIVAGKPEVKVLIQQLRKNFEGWAKEVRREKLNALMKIDGVCIRGLAEDTGISESTLRYYLEAVPRSKRAGAARKQPPQVKAADQIAAPSASPTVIQQQRPDPPRAVSPMRRIVLPPRPEPKVAVRARQTSELALLLLEFLEERGLHLGFLYPRDFRLVSDGMYSLIKEIPDRSNQDIIDIPTEEARAKLFAEIEVGRSPDVDRMRRLAIGLKNLMLKIGGSKSMWNEALNELDQRTRNLLRDQAEEDRAEKARLAFSGAQAQTPQPRVRPAEIRWAPHPNDPRYKR